jgi:integrase/recombinase XerD
MTATIPSTALATVQPVFTDSERLALAGFLAGYRGLTREAYTLDLRQFTAWCRTRSLSLFAVRRADMRPSPGTWRPRPAPAPPSPGGCAPSPGSTSTRSGRNSSSTPRPRTSAAPAGLSVACHRAGPQRARRAPGRRRARAARRARPDLAARAQRAAGLGGDRRRHRAAGLERGHRTPVITRKGGKVVTIPLAPRTARAIDLAIDERTEGPLFLTADGRRLDRHGTARIVRRVTRRAAIAKQVSPHTLRHAFITAALDAGGAAARCAEGRLARRPRTTMRYDRARTSLDRHATYIVAAFIAAAAR